MKRQGAEKESFDTIAVSGKRTSMPHGVPTQKEIEKGDFVTMDFGAVVDGYHSDMTRTVAVGFADDGMKEVYNTVLKKPKAGIAALAVGVKCSDADKVCRDIIKARDSANISPIPPATESVSTFTNSPIFRPFLPIPSKRATSSPSNPHLHSRKIRCEN